MVKRESINHDEYNDIVNSLVGVLSDERKALEDYRKERVAERYGVPFETERYTAEANPNVTMTEDKEKN